MATIKKKAEIEIDAGDLAKVDKDLQKIERALEDVGDEAREASQEASNLGNRLNQMNDKVNESFRGFDEFAGRLGQVSNALMVLSGVAIVGVVTGIKDGITAFYEMTEAGQAAKASQEALTSAIGTHIGKLAELKKITSETVGVTFQLINAQGQQELLSGRLKKRAADIVDAQEEYAKALRDVAILEEKGQTQTGRFSERTGAQITTPYDRAKLNVEIKRSAMVRAQAEFDQDVQRLAAINKVLENLGQTFEKVSGATSQTEASASKAADTLEQELAEALRALGDNAEYARGGISSLGSLIDSLPDTGVVFEDIIGTEDAVRRLNMLLNDLNVDDSPLGKINEAERQALLDLEDSYAEALDLAKKTGADVNAITERYEKKRTEIMTNAAEQRAKASGFEGEAHVRALEQFTQGLANAAIAALLTGESFGEMAHMALLALAQMAGTEAIMETARGIADLASGTWPPNPAAIAAATQHFASAGIFAGIAVGAGVGAKVTDPGSTGGGGGGSGAGSSTPNPREVEGSPQASRETVINLNFTGQPLATNTELQDFVVKGINEAETRRSARRINPTRIRKGRSR